MLSLPELEERHTVSRIVHAAIRHAIVERRLAAGTRLIVDRLAAELKVSRTPVKEALAKLEREGLVRTIPHRGAHVITISEQDLAEIYFLREVAEGLSARLAAPAISEESLARLRRLIDDGAAVLAAGDFDTYAELDLEFHRTIRRSGGNGRLEGLMDNLDGQVRIIIPTSSALPGRREVSVPEHRRIEAALAARDARAAEEAMRDHVARARAALLTHWRDAFAHHTQHTDESGTHRILSQGGSR